MDLFSRYWPHWSAAMPVLMHVGLSFLSLISLRNVASASIAEKVHGFCLVSLLWASCYLHDGLIKSSDVDQARKKISSYVELFKKLINIKKSESFNSHCGVLNYTQMQNPSFYKPCRNLFSFLALLLPSCPLPYSITTASFWVGWWL